MLAKLCRIQVKQSFTSADGAMLFSAPVAIGNISLLSSGNQSEPSESPRVRMHPPTPMEGIVD